LAIYSSGYNDILCSGAISRRKLEMAQQEFFVVLSLTVPAWWWRMRREIAASYRQASRIE
jgi:hypothetical protein